METVFTNAMTTQRATFGQEIATEYGPRGVIGKPERSTTGNIVLRVGNENIDDSTGFRRVNGWSQVAHVVLTPDEARELVDLIRGLL